MIPVFLSRVIFSINLDVCKITIESSYRRHPIFGCAAVITMLERCAFFAT